jgi:hypothetical protein
MFTPPFFEVAMKGASLKIPQLCLPYANAYGTQTESFLIFHKDKPISRWGKKQQILVVLIDLLAVLLGRLNA